MHPSVIRTVFLAIAASPLGAQTPENLEKVRLLDAYATQATKDWQGPGVAIAVVKDGRVVLSRGYGNLELGKPNAVDTQTLFAIGSATKAMTAVALGMLVDEGKINWDDPVTKHLPQFQLYDAYVSREITVRDLLTHRAGLPGTDYLWEQQTLQPEEMIRRLRFVQPAYSLRSGFRYQNLMYVTAGQVIASASGMSWSNFIHRRILQPLGMTRTVTSSVERDRMTNVASPHFIWEDTVHVISNRNIDHLAPAGGVWSTIEDMSKWIRFMLDSGRFEGKALLKRNTFVEITKPQTVITNFFQSWWDAETGGPHWHTYGLGWFQQDFNGRKVDFHTGSIDGMAAIVGLMLDEKLGVVVLTNLDHNNARIALMLKTFELFTGAPPRDWSMEWRKALAGDARQAREAQAKLEAKRVFGTKPSLPLISYAGEYADSLYGSRSILVENGKLRMKLGQDWATLEHWDYDTFRARYDKPWYGTNFVTFRIGADGSTPSLEVGDLTFQRVSP